ncbi:E3 ubiquitin-protein ligase XBAT32-like isoform X2 [Impatiens glandulifera]|uniref:E3 ubiquitin-protein ligase XBAT32-like isoform X2 n=1 Tax=Impatiens glandulifera TaxID=253017 RepID=UPI001FB15A23|nr:E3 ubiquitin-protein ligase XBAT32-like isoform X2 [Impatiens glandulifera]
MRFLSLVGNSFGCSASGERLVSAARDGDLQEAKALLEYNPRLARYSTFGIRNSPLHYSAAQGHHEIVSLLLESGVDINLRNYRGQTALMQACQHGHWEVVQILILFKANIHKADYLNGGTALHLAALNGHSRCIRLLLTDYIPSSPNVWDILTATTIDDDSNNSEFDKRALYEIINRAADGGITALHMAALNGHVETVQLFLDFGASVSQVTVGDGTTIDLIGAGCTPLHYAACGGNAQCCQILISRGASLTAENANGLTPLMVSRSWHRDWLEQILSPLPQPGPTQLLPSPFLSLPLSSMVKIARECGWRSDSIACVVDPCVVCLENKCTVAAQGCNHEFCTQCALYLCSTNSTTSTAGNGPPGSIACPLCRHGIVSFAKLVSTSPLPKTTTLSSSSTLSLCSCSTTTNHQIAQDLLETSRLYRTESERFHPLGSSFRSLSCQRFPSLKFSPGFCVGSGSESTRPCLVRRNNVDREFQNQLARLRRSASQATDESRSRRSWFCALNQYVATAGGCS